MHDFLSQNARIFPLHISLTKRIDGYSPKELTNFSWEVLKHFGPKKSHKKNCQISQRFLNYVKSSYVPNLPISSNHILLICTKIIFTIFANFCQHLGPTLPTLYHFPSLY